MEIIESKTYRSILDHRRDCPKWGKEFCLECFGGGLTIFFRDIKNEEYALGEKSE